MPEKKKKAPLAKPKKSPAKPLKGDKKTVKPAPKKETNPLKSKVKSVSKPPKSASQTKEKPVHKPIAKPAPKPETKSIAQSAKIAEKNERHRPSQEAVAPKVEKGEKEKEKKEKKTVKVGDMAPDFTLKDQFGNDVKLSALKGKKVLLSFHPLAWTPICELQMRSLELKKSDFDKLNTVPLGISVDSMYSKREWATFLELDQVQILADFWPHGEVAKKYGQFIDKGGVSGRVNILVDENGKIIWMKVYDIKQVPDIEEVLAVIREKSAL